MQDQLTQVGNDILNFINDDMAWTDINKSKKIITNIIHNTKQNKEYAKTILYKIMTDEAFNQRQKYYALIIIRDTFVQAGFTNEIGELFADKAIFTKLQAQIMLFFQAKGINNKLDQKTLQENPYYPLLLECIEEWAIIFDPKSSNLLEIYGQTYRELSRKGIQFPKARFMPVNILLNNSLDHLNAKSAKSIDIFTDSEDVYSQNQHNNSKGSNERTSEKFDGNKTPNDSKHNESSENLGKSKTGDVQLKLKDNKIIHLNYASLSAVPVNNLKQNGLLNKAGVPNPYQENSQNGLISESVLKKKPITHMQHDVESNNRSLQMELTDIPKFDGLANNPSTASIELAEPSTFSQTLGLVNNPMATNNHPNENLIIPQLFKQTTTVSVTNAFPTYESSSTNQIPHASNTSHSNQVLPKVSNTITNAYKTPDMAYSGLSYPLESPQSILKNLPTVRTIVATERTSQDKNGLERLLEESRDDDVFDFEKHNPIGIIPESIIDNNSSINLNGLVKDEVKDQSLENVYLEIQKEPIIIEGKHKSSKSKEMVETPKHMVIKEGPSNTEQDKSKWLFSPTSNQITPKSDYGSKPPIPFAKSSGTKTHKASNSLTNDNPNTGSATKQKERIKINLNTRNKSHANQTPSKSNGNSNNPEFNNEALAGNEKNYKQGYIDTDRPSTIDELSCSLRDSSFVNDLPIQLEYFKPSENEMLPRRASISSVNSSHEILRNNLEIMNPLKVEDNLMINENQSLKLENCDLKKKIDHLSAQMNVFSKDIQTSNANHQQEIKALRLEIDNLKSNKEKYEQEIQRLMDEKAEQAKKLEMYRQNLQESSLMIKSYEIQVQEKQKEKEHAEEQVKLASNQIYLNGFGVYTIVQVEEKFREHDNLVKAHVALQKRLSQLESMMIQDGLSLGHSNNIDFNEEIKKFRRDVNYLKEENSILRNMIDLSDKKGSKLGQDMLFPAIDMYSKSIITNGNSKIEKIPVFNEVHASPIKNESILDLELSSPKQINEITSQSKIYNDTNSIVQTQLPNNESLQSVQEKAANRKKYPKNSLNKTENLIMPISSYSSQSTTKPSLKSLVQNTQNNNNNNTSLKQGLELDNMDNKRVLQNIGNFLRRNLEDDGLYDPTVMNAGSSNNIETIKPLNNLTIDTSYQYGIGNTIANTTTTNTNTTNTINLNPIPKNFIESMLALGLMENQSVCEQDLILLGCIKEKQIIYQNEIIEIEIETLEQPDDIQLVLIFKNKGKKSIEGLLFSITDYNTGYKITTKPNSVIHQNSSIEVIDTGSSQKHEFIISLIGNQADLPKIGVYYSYDYKKAYIESYMPIIITKFMRFLNITPQIFNSQKASYPKSNVISSNSIQFNQEYFQNLENVLRKCIKIDVADDEVKKGLVNCIKLCGEFKLSNTMPNFLIEVFYDTSKYNGLIKCYYENTNMREYALNVISSLCMNYAIPKITT